MTSRSTDTVPWGLSGAEARRRLAEHGPNLLPEPPGTSLVARLVSQFRSPLVYILLFALVLGLFVAYMVLGAQFNSFVHPFTVLMALPFSITGALIALRLTGITLNIYSMMVLLVLLGILKKPKRNFGKNRPIRCLKKFQSLFLRVVTVGMVQLQSYVKNSVRI